MKKGFTLIELLAVIVILAIIALIATPIILGIINDAREKANERSAELYASAVRNAIASYQLTGTSAPKSFDDLDIEYDGDVVCATEELYEDGSFYITDCTVNGTEVDYTYGEKQYIQVYKPQYYSWLGGSIGGDLPSDAKTNVLDIDTQGYPYYLGLDVDANNKVTAAYSCFTRNGIEYCLKGVDIDMFTTNTAVIKDAYADVVGTDACSFVDRVSHCGAGELLVSAYPNGEVYINDGFHYSCVVWSYGSFECYYP